MAIAQEMEQMAGTKTASSLRRKNRSRTAGSAPAASPLGISVETGLGLADQVESGLAFRALEHLSAALGVSLAETARLVQITPRTLARRRAQGRLQPDESDRVVRASRLFALACDLFEGDSAAARRWLTMPRAALGNRSPFDVSKTEVGAREVERLIGRLEHGVFS